ncbi:BTAD domain-containing putative transcriptional regulator [Planotetraspora sp. GP83]|uniref:AfsR/SARP family transcriptional regulator n=1 Tax=Planotetraspora sp. GP83 TaxID=3156264 RepID=UPI0035111C4A
MRFAILGQVEVTASDGRPIHLPPIQRRVLCALLIAGEAGMSAEALTRALWGDDDVRAHEGPLKSILSQLRRALPGRIPLGSSGRYRVVPKPGDRLDLEEFREFAARGTRAGDHAAAAKVLGEAMRLWGVPPLPELPDDDAPLREARDALLSERRAALLPLWESRLHLGEHHAVLREVRDELAGDPLSEALHRLVMLALYRSGQRVRALKHYASVAAMLRAETGAGPGSELRSLRDEIGADHDPSGRAPATSPGIVPAQLPPDVVDWTGRADEVAAMVEWLTPYPDRTGVPVVAVSGPGGVGKSALAVHVGHLVREHFPDGQLYANLHGMSPRPQEVAGVLGEMLTSLGVHPRDQPRTVGERTSLLRSLLAGRRVLVLLDDVAGAGQIPPLVPGTAGCAVIATSRAHLAEGAMRRIRLDPLPPEESMALLGEIIGRRRVIAEPEAAAKVVRACGGFPLAVRLHGARLSGQPHWSLAHFADLLGDGHETRTGDERALSENIADGSYEALRPDARRGFRVLSLAGRADFPAWVAAMLLGRQDADDLLEILTAHSLIAPAGVDAFGQPRHIQHDLLRDYASTRLAGNLGERDAAKGRLLRGWLELADLADSHLHHDPHHPPPRRLGAHRDAPAKARRLVEGDPRGWFAAEIDNLLDVIQLACAEGDVQMAARIALAVNTHLFWVRRDYDAEDMWQSIMRAAGNDTEPAAEARLRIATLINRRPGGARRAVPMLDACVQASGDARAARSLAARAFAAWTWAAEPDMDPRQRDELLSRGTADAERGLAVARAAGDRHSEMACLRAAGVIMASRGDHGGIRLCEAALGIARSVAEETGERAYEAYTLRLLVMARLSLGHYEEALTSLTQSHDLIEMFDHRAGEAAWAEMKADALTGLGRHREAADMYAAAARLYEGDAAPHHGRRCQEKHAAAIDQAKPVRSR